MRVLQLGEKPEGRNMKSLVCDMVGCEFPLFAFSHGRDVVAAVTNAGGFGVLGGVSHTPKTLDVELSWIDEQVNGKPYGLDLIVPTSMESKEQSMTAEEINRAERMGQALNAFYNLPRTRQEMFRQVAEGRESIIQFCDAIGTFIQDFELLDRDELRRGDIIRTVDQAYLMKILKDFERFRGELIRKVNCGLESLGEPAWAGVA